MLFHEDLEAYIDAQKRKLAALHTSKLPAFAVIRGVYTRVGIQAKEGAASLTQATDGLEVDALGVVGDERHGVARPSGGREGHLYPRRTAIRQHRHLCVVSRHDCRVLSERLGVAVTPELLGANLLLDGADGAELSLAIMPRGTHLFVVAEGARDAPKPPLATLVHHVNQRGCGITGKVIADHYGDKALVRAFREQANHHRGILCSVEYPVATSAVLRPGMGTVLRFPVGEAP